MGERLYGTDLTDQGVPEDAGSQAYEEYGGERISFINVTDLVSKEVSAQLSDRQPSPRTFINRLTKDADLSGLG